MIKTNVEEMKKWIRNAISIVDRGFHDLRALLNDMEFNTEIPSFLSRHSKHHYTEEANATRIVTKVNKVAFMLHSQHTIITCTSIW